MKRGKKFLAVILVCSMAVGNMGLNYRKTKADTVTTEQLGQGSIASQVPEELKSTTKSLPTLDNSGTIRFTTDNYNANHGAFDTNNWGTSAMWNFFGGTKYSGSIYTYPLSYRATDSGMWITKPCTRTGSTYCVMTLPATGAYTDFSVKPSFDSDCAKVDNITDWTYDIVMENENNRSQYMKTTMTQGSPFGFFEMKNAKTVDIVRYRKDVSSTIAYYNGSSLGNSTYVVLKTYDDKDDEAGYSKYDYYGIYVPRGTSWNQTGNSAEHIGTLSLTFPSDSKSYFSIAWLTESNDSDSEALTIAKEYNKYAYNFITDTRAEYSYEQETSTVTTTYKYIVEKKAESQADGTIMGIMPHQYKNISENLDYMPNIARTLRGTVKFVKGNQFVTKLKFAGVLPYATDIEESEKSVLQSYVDEYMSSKMPSGGNYSLCVDESVGDPYATGKQLNRAANVMAAAEQTGDTESSNRILKGMEKDLANWFTYSGQGDGKFFAYSDEMGALFSYPTTYNSIDQMNDHHFHYGYFIAAAGQVGLRDKEWIKKYGPVVEELIEDIACTTRNNKDSRYPYLRNFSPFEGHSWASGFEDPESGNNQESTSEAMNAWYGIILYGMASGNSELRDLGIYLYTTELSAINAYWLDIDGDVLDTKYVYQGKSEPTNVMASLVWGGKYDYATWFSADAAMVQGIQLLPMTAGSYYLATDKEYIRKYWNALRKKSSSTSWNDVWSEYLALAAPDEGFDNWSGKVSEDGETKAHTFHYIKALQKAGTPETSITSDTELSMVFVNGSGEKTYSVYNAEDKMKVVTFSDGAKFSAKANTMTTYTESQMAGQEYYIEYYLQNAKGEYELYETQVDFAKEGTQIKAEAVTKNGYALNQAKSTTSGTVTSNGLILKMYYDRGTYSISYEYNGASEVSNPVKYTYGDNIQLNAPTKEGYTFKGWYTESNFKNKVEKIDENTYGNLKLYARWISDSDYYIEDDMYMQMKDNRATFVVNNDTASMVTVLYYIADSYEKAIEHYNKSGVEGYTGYNLENNNGVWSRTIDFSQSQGKYIVFTYNIVGAGAQLSAKGMKQITEGGVSQEPSTEMPTEETSTIIPEKTEIETTSQKETESWGGTEDPGVNEWTDVLNNGNYSYAVTEGEGNVTSIHYESNYIFISLRLAAVFSSVTVNGKQLEPEAGAFVKLYDNDIKNGKYFTIIIKDHYDREQVKLVVKNNLYVEETTVQEETTIPEETTMQQSPEIRTSPLLNVEGYQISHSLGASRVVASVEPVVEGKRVINTGMVYAIENLDGKDYITDDNQLYVGNDNRFVISYQTTDIGYLNTVMGDSLTAMYYARTMTFGANTIAAFNTRYKVRAYAQLEDGTYVYSNVENYTVYNIAQKLYDNCKMNTYVGHQYLYDMILSKVTPGYREVDYDWGTSLVN